MLTVGARNQEKGVVRARKTPDAGECREADTGTNRPPPIKDSPTTGLTLQLSNGLAGRLAEEAARQGITPEEVAAHMLAESVVMQPHHGLATVHRPTASAAERTGPTAAGPSEQQGRPRRSAARLINEAPNAVRVGISLLFCTAILILIVVLIAEAL
jgi:hypothetical protein